jgi:hypothetical protein
MKQKFVLAAVSAGLLAPVAVSAQQITGWDQSNVEVPAVNPPDGVTGESIIYDRDPTLPGAVTNGKIVYTPPEGVLPGIEVENGAYSFGPAGVSPIGCILASGPSTCDGPRQSGKRFKQVVTGNGPIDLSFNVDPNLSPDPNGDESFGYRVFHRLINATGRLLNGFSVSLGTGIGNNFMKSAAGDGLAFSAVDAFGDPQGPGLVSESAFYPFGLYGDAATNPNFDLDGFFDGTGRAGFELAASEDMISSTGFFGKNDDLFGGWLSQSQVPTGALWDNDGDPGTDALVMAWFDSTLGKWEIRRDIDPLDPTKAVSLASSVFRDTFGQVEDYLGLVGASALEEDFIEDLANLNLNYGISLDGFTGTQFTVRVQTSPVPLPAGLPLLATALAIFGFLRRRKAA